MHQKKFFVAWIDCDHVLPISGYDLENGRMLCKQKYKILKMAVKILTMILFCFFNFTEFLLSLW